jgi:hypothetical protein
MKKRLATLLALGAGVIGFTLPATASAASGTGASGVGFNVGPCLIIPVKPGFSGTTAYYGSDQYCPSYQSWEVLNSLQVYQNGSWVTKCYQFTVGKSSQAVIDSCGPEYPFASWRTLTTFVTL